jgi:hypothetical protein
MSETDSINASAIQDLTKRATQLWWRCEAAIERIERWVKSIMNSAPEATRGNTRCTDESVQGSDSAHININRFTLPKDARDILIATVMAAAILTIVVLGFLLHDAYKDIQTQVWLRDDALTKFMTGPYADLRAEVKANQIVIQTLGAQCQKPK